MGFLNLFPTSPPVFDDVVKLGALVQDAAVMFRNLAYRPEELLAGNAIELFTIEDAGDKVVHGINVQLANLFIVPILEKDDIQAFAKLLDDVLDFIEEAADRMKRFHLSVPMAEVQEFAELIFRSVDHINRALQLIRKKQYGKEEFERHYKAIHSIENQGDELHRRTLDILNDEDMDIRLIQKLMTVYAILEETLDTCEDIANAFEGIRIRYS